MSQLLFVSGKPILFDWDGKAGNHLLDAKATTEGEELFNAEWTCSF